MRGEELRWLLDPDVLRNRPERRPKRLDRLLGGEDVEDTEPVRSLSGRVNEQPSNGRSDGDSIRLFPVRRRTTSSYLSWVRFGV